MIRVALFFIITSFFPSVASAGESITRLDPQKVVQLALEQSTEVESARLDEIIAREEIRAARSVYDTNLSLKADYMHDESQKSSTFLGTDNHEFNASGMVNQKIPLGTDISVGYTTTRLSTDSIFTTVNPSWNPQLTGSIRQPIARNFFGFLDQKQISWAKTMAGAATHKSEARIQAAIYMALVHYWEFYFAGENFYWGKQALERARKLLSANQSKMSLGLIEKGDLEAFKANVAFAETKNLDEKNLLIQKTEQLRFDLGLSPEIKFVPSKPVFSPYKKISTNDAIIEALRQRADYTALQKEVKATGINLSMKKNSLWPQIDLSASLALNGIDDTHAQALDNLENGHPQWKVGMEFNFPLNNRMARARKAQAKMDRSQKLLALKNRELEITRQIMEKVQQISNKQSRLASAKRARGHQLNKLHEETKKFELGRSDSDTLIRYQNDYIDAEKLLLMSTVDYEVGLVDLKFVQGKILEIQN